MYCSQCGKELSEKSKFCSNCGCPVKEENKPSSAPVQQSSFDAVEDIQKKLREIDSRKRPSTKKGGVVKSAFDSLKETIREEASASGLGFFNDSFEEQKLTDKKQLILNYPLPTSPKALASFAKYINSEIEAKKKAPDALTPVWKEKLKQVHLFAEAEMSSTGEFAEIQKCHKANKRRERHAAIREFVVLLIFPIIAAFIVSLVFSWPLLLFASILAAGWEVFLILYVYDLLDDMVASIKQHSAKRPNIPKRLRSAAWHLLVPFLAALITAIAYHSVGLIVLFAILFGVDAFFLLLFMCDVYGL